MSNLKENMDVFPHRVMSFEQIKKYKTAGSCAEKKTLCTDINFKEDKPCFSTEVDTSPHHQTAAAKSCWGLAERIGKVTTHILNSIICFRVSVQVPNKKLINTHSPLYSFLMSFVGIHHCLWQWTAKQISFLITG